jgi:hypothetical protein
MYVVIVHRVAGNVSPRSFLLSTFSISLCTRTVQIHTHVFIFHQRWKVSITYHPRSNPFWCLCVSTKFKGIRLYVTQVETYPLICHPSSKRDFCLRDVTRLPVLSVYNRTDSTDSCDDHWKTCNILSWSSLIVPRSEEETPGILCKLYQIGGVPPM